MSLDRKTLFDKNTALDLPPAPPASDENIKGHVLQLLRTFMRLGLGTERTTSDQISNDSPSAVAAAVASSPDRKSTRLRIFKSHKDKSESKRDVTAPASPSPRAAVPPPAPPAPAEVDYRVHELVRGGVYPVLFWIINDADKKRILEGLYTYYDILLLESNHAHEEELHDRLSMLQLLIANLSSVYTEHPKLVHIALLIIGQSCVSGRCVENFEWERNTSCSGLSIHPMLQSPKLIKTVMMLAHKYIDNDHVNMAILHIISFSLMPAITSNDPISPDCILLQWIENSVLKYITQLFESPHRTLCRKYAFDLCYMIVNRLLLFDEPALGLFLYKIHISSILTIVEALMKLLISFTAVTPTHLPFMPVSCFEQVYWPVSCAESCVGKLTTMFGLPVAEEAVPNSKEAAPKHVPLERIPMTCHWDENNRLLPWRNMLTIGALLEIERSRFSPDDAITNLLSNFFQRVENTDKHLLFARKWDMGMKCFHCNKVLIGVGRRHHCRICGKAVCSKYGPVMTMWKTKVRICNQCGGSLKIIGTLDRNIDADISVAQRDVCCRPLENGPLKTWCGAA